VEDFRTKSYGPPDGPRDRGYWHVHLAIEPNERDLIEEVAPTVVPGERVTVHYDTIENENGADAVLALSVFAESSTEAVEEASYRYRQILSRAGLPKIEAQVLGYISPWWGQKVAIRLGDEAVNLLKQKRFELAVIRLQTSCELHVYDYMETLLEERHPGMDVGALVRRPASLRDKQSKAFLQLLTGKRIQDESWWPKYFEHLKRRNAIVHEGLAITHEDAVKSFDAVQALREWFLGMMGVPELEENEDLDDVGSSTD
jgi:hypothetical protein